MKKATIPPRERGRCAGSQWPPGLPALEALVADIRRRQFGELEHTLPNVHPADLADLFGAVDSDEWPRMFACLDVDRMAALFAHSTEQQRVRFTAMLDRDRLTDVLAHMASDDVADLLSELAPKLAAELAASLPPTERRAVRELLRYPEDSAGGLMQTETVSVAASATVDQAIDAIRSRSDHVGDLYFVYVLDDEDRLAGVLRLDKLLLSRRDRPIRELMKRDCHVIAPLADQEEVAASFRRYDLLALPVVDDDGVLLGRILYDDAVDVLEREADEDILQMVGVDASGPELVYTNRVFRIASVRIPWLMATFAGLNVSALLYWQFQNTFPQMPALIPFIPMISAMGGNVGTQSSTIVVRGFAIGRVDFHNLRRVVTREVTVGLMMGVVCGITAGVVAFVWHGNGLLSLTVALSMICAMVLATSIGTLVPYLFKLIRIDPAVASGPLITTIEDVLATTVYYLIATVLLLGRTG